MPSSPAPEHSGCSILCVLFIGTLLGTVGQIARVAAGLKKETDKPENAGKKYSDWFDMGEFIVSLLIGAAAGAMAAIGLMGAAIDKRFLVACITAGYAGADFVGAFMSNNVSGGNNRGLEGGRTTGEKTPISPDTGESGGGKEKAPSGLSEKWQDID